MVGQGTEPEHDVLVGSARWAVNADDYTRFLFRTDRGQLRALERRIGQVRQKLDGMSRGFSIAGGVITGALVGAGRPLDDFSKSINRLERDLQPTNEQLAMLKAQAIEIGNNARYTTINVEDVINAQRELGKAGLTVNEVMSLTPKIMDLVAATELDVADAASRGVKLMSAFGLTVADMGPLFDRMAWTAVNANTTFDQLLNGVSRIGPTARVAGYDVEEMVAAFAMLNAINIQPERAETGLRQFMIKLGDLDKLPEDAIEALKELDITIDELKFMKGQGDFLGLLELFKERGAGIMEISRAFGSEAAPIILGLMENVAQAGALMADATEESAGQVVDQAVIMNKGFSGALAAMRSSYQTAIIALGDAGLNDILIDYVTRIRSVTEAFMALDDETKRMVTTGLAMGPVLLGLAGFLKAVSFALGGLALMLKTPILLLGGLAALLAGTLIGWNRVGDALKDTPLGGMWDEFLSKAQWAWGEIRRLFHEHVGRELDLSDPDFWRDIRDMALDALSELFWKAHEGVSNLAAAAADALSGLDARDLGGFFLAIRNLFVDTIEWIVNYMAGIDWSRLYNDSMGRFIEQIVRTLAMAIHDIDWWQLIVHGKLETDPGRSEETGLFDHGFDFDAAIEAGRRNQEERERVRDTRGRTGLPPRPGWFDFGPEPDPEPERERVLRGDAPTTPAGPVPPPEDSPFWQQLTQALSRPGPDGPAADSSEPIPVIVGPMPSAPPVLPAQVTTSPGTSAGAYGPAPPPNQVQVTVESGAITINTPDGDPETIRGALEGELGNMFSNLAEDYDGNVDR